MKAAFDEAKSILIVWKLFIVRATLFSIVTLGTAWMTATSGLDVGALPFWDKVTLVVGIIVLWGNQMVAMLDKTAGKIASGSLPVESDGQEKQTTKGNE